MDTNTTTSSIGGAATSGLDALAGLFQAQDLGGARPAVAAQDTGDDQDEASSGADTGDEEALELAGEAEDGEGDPPEDNAEDVPPPAGMGADDLALWAKLDPEAKRFVAEQEARRTADYTRKASEAAALRREAEETKAAWAGRVQQQLQWLGQLAEAELTPPDPKLAEDDPFEYAKQIGHYQTALHEQSKVRQHQAQLAQELQAQYEADHKAYVTSEREKLLKEVPAFADPVKGPVLARQVAEYADKNGITTDQLKKASAMEIGFLRKAMLYDQAVQKAKGAGKPPASKPTPAAAPGRLPGTPGASQAKSKRIENLKQAHQKSGGKLETMAAFWGEYLKD